MNFKPTIFLLLIGLVGNAFAASIPTDSITVGSTSLRECLLSVSWSETSQYKTVYLVDRFGLKVEGMDQRTEVSVMVEHIYPNVDLLISPVRGQKLRYEFTIYPGGQAGDVLLTCQSVSSQLASFKPLPLAFQDQGGIQDRRIEATLDTQNESVVIDLGRYDQASPVVVVFETDLGQEGWQPEMCLARLIQD